jgi:hypothetical protein
MALRVSKAEISCGEESWSLDLQRSPSLIPLPLRTALLVGVSATKGEVSKGSGLVVEPGTHTEDSREFFISGDKTAGILRLQRREDGWVASLGKSLIPFVLSKAAVDQHLMPPAGQSGLPVSLQSVVPQDMRYWEKSVEEAMETRDALVASGLFSDNVVKIVDGQLRLCATKLFLYEPDEPESSADSIKRLLGEHEVAWCTNDWEEWEAGYEEASKSEGLLVLSVEPEHAVKAAERVVSDANRVADLFMSTCDMPETRIAFGKVGVAFKLARHPDSLFVATMDLANERGVCWLAKSEPVAVSKPFAGYSDFGDCVAQQVASGKDEEAAKKICGSLQAEYEKEVPSVKRWVISSKDESAPEEERFVLGIVLEPEVVDSQKDIYSAGEIRKACHAYMEHFRGNTLMHDKHIEGRVVLLENYIAPADFSFGEQAVKAGTWLQAYRVTDDDVWKACIKGDLTGLSIGGSAVREPDGNTEAD